MLQLADRSTRTPRGVVEDVLLQIDKFYYLVDFLILDTQSVVKAESKIPLILGRPFLATANALINCRNGLMKLSFGNMTLEVNIFNIGKQPQDDDDYHHTYLIDSLVPEFASTLHDPISPEHLLSDPMILDTLNPTMTAATSQIVPIPQDHGFRMWQPRFEALPTDRERPKPSSVETPKVDLKALPQGLRYAFLGQGDTFHVIIFSDLSAEQSKKLIDMLNEHKSALGWTIGDIKGVSPLICSHMIHLEEGAVPHRDPQRRLNPTMNEVVKNEVIKLLDAGIIYPIADSQWVSPTQVVPKKYGVTVVKNEVGDLVPTNHGVADVY